MRITPISFAAISNPHNINNTRMRNIQVADSVSFKGNIDEPTKARAISIFNEAITEFQEAQKAYEKSDYIENFVHPILNTLVYAAKTNKEYIVDKNGFYNLDVPKSINCKYFSNKDKLKTKIYENGAAYFEANSVKYPGTKIIANIEQGGYVTVVEDGVVYGANKFDALETHCYINETPSMIKLGTKQNKFGATYDKIFEYEKGGVQEIGIKASQPDVSTITVEKNMNFKRGKMESCEINKIFIAPNSTSCTEIFQYKRGKIIHKTIQDGKAQKEVIRI